MQGHLGAFLVDVDPAFAGLPTGRHEAACASGSIALLAASAEIEAGRYELRARRRCRADEDGLARPSAATTSAPRRGTSARPRAWSSPSRSCSAGSATSTTGATASKDEHLARISAINYDNARKNPQGADAHLVHVRRARLPRRQPTTRSSAGASRSPTARRSPTAPSPCCWPRRSSPSAWAARRGTTLAEMPRLRGWGHRTAPLTFDDKVAESREQPYVLPHTRRAIVDALRRAGLADCWALDGIETHDCFTTSEYMAIDHFGLTAPGESWKAVEEGVIAIGGQAADQSVGRAHRLRPPRRRHRRAPAARRLRCRRAGGPAATRSTAPRPSPRSTSGARERRAACSSSVFDSVNDVVDAVNHV